MCMYMHPPSHLQANVLVLSFALSGTLLSTAEMVIISLLFVYLLLVVFLGLMAVSLS